MDPRGFQELVEHATSPDLVKPDLPTNKRICMALRENEAL